MRLRGNRSGGVYKGCRFVEFVHDSASEFTAFATFAGHAEFAAYICHATGTTATEIANLVVSHLPADTYVHKVVLNVDANLNDNENDCQQVLDLVLYAPDLNQRHFLKPLYFKDLTLYEPNRPIPCYRWRSLRGT